MSSGRHGAMLGFSLYRRYAHFKFPAIYFAFGGYYHVDEFLDMIRHAYRLYQLAYANSLAVAYHGMNTPSGYLPR